MKQKLVVAVLAGFVCAFALAVRVVGDGRHALEAGDAAWARGEGQEALRFWHRAARSFAPGAPHVKAAYARISGTSELAQARTNPRFSPGRSASSGWSFLAIVGFATFVGAAFWFAQNQEAKYAIPNPDSDRKKPAVLLALLAGLLIWALALCCA